MLWRHEDRTSRCRLQASKPGSPNILVIAALIIASAHIPYSVGRNVISLSKNKVAIDVQETTGSKAYMFDGKRIQVKDLSDRAFGSNEYGDLCTLNIRLHSLGEREGNYGNSKDLFGDLFLENGVFIRRLPKKRIEVQMKDETWLEIPRVKSFDGLAVSPSSEIALIWGDPILEKQKSYVLVNRDSRRIRTIQLRQNGTNPFVRQNGNIVMLDSRFAVFLASPGSIDDCRLSALPHVLTCTEPGFVQSVLCVLDTSSGQYLPSYLVKIEGREFQGGSLDRERVLGRLSPVSCAVLGFDTVLELNVSTQIDELSLPQDALDADDSPPQLKT